MRTVLGTLAISLVLVPFAAAMAADDPLPSWNDGAAKTAIVAFVARVTTEGSTDFVAPAQRIATFDNDGTLWTEQPFYFQLAFALDRVKSLAPEHPEWRGQQPFKAALEGDAKTVAASGHKGLGEILAATHAGMTTTEFEAAVRDWIKTARHPRFQRPYNELVYRPMLELMAYLRANGFKTFIVSGGGIDFMRPWVDEAYGIPPEQVVGSSGELKYELRDGEPVLVKLPKINLVDDGPGKPVGIQRHIGRRPIASFGNSDGDYEMLRWTSAGEGLRLCMIVHHTDAEREYAYDRGSHIGKLEKGLDEAAERDWVLIDMKQDWKVIYPFDVNASKGE